MSNKSEQAYWWIDARAKSLSKWIDSNRGRLLLMAIFACLGIWGLLLEGKDDLTTVQRFIRGMGPELAGIVIAAVTIDALAERRLEQERRAQLIRQLGSQYRDITEMAIIELTHKGWLEDGSLSGLILDKADLSGANLSRANLSGAVLVRVNLSGADLGWANLSGAYLGWANLSGAKLWDANLSGALLEQADLSGAYLVGVNLSGASLLQANLSGASLWNANLSGASVGGADLSGAGLSRANLGKAKGWTIEQLEQVEEPGGAIMPDGIQLGQEKTGYLERIEGPTFEEWKVHYLAEHGGTVTDVRDTLWAR